MVTATTTTATTTNTINVASKIPDKIEATSVKSLIGGYTNLDIHFRKDQDVIDPKTGVLTVGPKEYEAANHPEWLPTWDPNEKYEPYSDDFNNSHVDRAHFADSNLKNLFPEGGDYKIKKISPKLGSEVRGIQLSQLTNEQKDDLALLVAQRGVVVFREQDLKDKGLEFNKKFGEHFGPLHIHPSSGAPEGYPEFHLTYRRKDPNEYEKVFKHNLSTKGWHSDVTYEKFPPSYTFFALLQGPETGGDTLFSDGIEAYRRLSPTFKKMIQGLKVTHSSIEQAAQSRAEGSIERKTPSSNLHPLARIHPILKEKSLFISRAFITKIDGLKSEESKAILDLLTEHINNSVDLQIRASYEPGTVVVWDNRRVIHSASFDWDEGDIRHCYRITPMAERPVEEYEELEEWNRR
ncbi:hypothetical protein WICMUC_002798 [Wickerhamomyces mucosus]|uniref:TauD/TfdA-like domain-containing protein n=1 Tax=Wickerhamomyces mucosus TaxID=1378264 RepID=A0A9P8PNG5_9ASCO|nr:hypothetical protein WICMUC_002798 [Wickerhamomyces mucosus]